MARRVSYALLKGRTYKCICSKAKMQNISHLLIMLRLCSKWQLPLNLIQKAGLRHHKRLVDLALIAMICRTGKWSGVSLGVSCKVLRFI